MAILIFIVVLVVLVLAHEAGHFFTAKGFGIKVEEFGFGFPPRVAGIKKGETLYSFNILPLGGFVRIFGEEGGERSDQRSFGSKSAWQRSVVLLAGVAANIVLAFLIFSVVSVIGTPKVILEEEVSMYPSARITIVEVSSNSPAYEGGIQMGDKVKSVNQIVPESLEELQNIIKENSGKSAEIVLERNGDVLTKKVVPRAKPPEGEGPLGVSLSWTVVEKSTWYKVPIEGAKITWNTLAGTILGFSSAIKNLVVGERQNIQITGPVGIFNITKGVSSTGLNMLLMLVGVLSVNLAVLNTIPFPGLDGGRFLFVILESIRKKPISPKVGAIYHGIGLAILIILMVLITIRDISKIF
mgnify:CR=1 FL=1